MKHVRPFKNMIYPLYKLYVSQVMLLWLLAYILIGQVAVPTALSLLGLDRDDMGVRGHAVLHLCLDL